LINKEKFQKESKEILKKNKALSNKDFETLFKTYENKDNSINKTLVADEFINKMFGSLYTETLIPWSFFDTEIGKLVLKIKYDYEDNRIYTIKDVTRIINKSKQFVGQEIHSGKLIAYKKDGKITIYKQDLDNYLKRREKKQGNINIYKEEEERIITPDNGEEKLF
jgi:hypothetical protein